MWLNLEHPHQFFKFFFVYFTQKTYFFYFTLSLLQNTHISLFILQDISIKYSFFSIFLLFLSTTLYLHTLSLSLSQKLPTQITFSPANPDPFFTDQSTNQAPQAPIYLSVGLSVRVCFFVCVFLCWFFSVDVFVCIRGKEDEELRSLCTEKREKNWCERKLIK